MDLIGTATSIPETAPSNDALSLLYNTTLNEIGALNSAPNTTDENGIAYADSNVYGKPEYAELVVLLKNWNLLYLLSLFVGIYA